MASSGKSEKLGLSLWESTDRPERLDFRQDNERLEQLVGGHIAEAALHLTPDEKEFLARPYWVSVYRGTGNATRTAVAPATARAIIVLCGDHPATVRREDGKTDVYWDFWSIGDSQRDYLGAGGVESKKGSKQWAVHSMNSTKDQNLVFHLNDTGTYYLALFLPAEN